MKININKKYGIWILSLLLSLFLLLIIPDHIGSSIIITLIFTIIAYLVHLYFAVLAHKSNSDVARDIPTITVSSIYITIQFLICIIVAFLEQVISIKATLIINVVPLIIALIILLSTNSAKEYAKKIDSRQKDHHIEL